MTQWLRELPHVGLFTESNLREICFLQDSGYDCKKIQRTILAIGSHFVAALKSSRTVNDWRVKEYFKRHKCHASKTIRFKGSGRKRITFQVRLATNVRLKGVGNVNVVCSKGRRGKKVTMKYLVSSANLTARNIVKYYRVRWAIETWHKEVKQKFGFGDNSCKAFHAVQAHVQLVIIAYILKTMVSSIPEMIEDYQVKKILLKIREGVTRFNYSKNLHNEIKNALERMAA